MIWKRLHSPRIGACRPLRPSRQPRSRSLRTAARCCTRHFRRRTRSFSRAPFWPLATGSTEPWMASSIIWRHARPSSILLFLCFRIPVSRCNAPAPRPPRVSLRCRSTRSRRSTRAHEMRWANRSRHPPQQRSATMRTIRSTAMPMTAASWRQPAFRRAKSVHPPRRPATSCWASVKSHTSGCRRQIPGADPLRFDFDKDIGNLNKSTPLVTFSASTDLAKFKNRGGKIIWYHGVSDPGPPVQGTIAYYDALTARNGGPDATATFARLFLVPNMGHCRGGPATDQFDMLSPLVAWVEHGTAPDRIIASGNALCLAPGHPQPAALSISAGNALCRSRRRRSWRGGQLCLRRESQQLKVEQADGATKYRFIDQPGGWVG